MSLGTSVVRDEQGSVVGLIGVARDISEQRKRKGRLRLQEAALAATVDAVVITDRDGTIEWVNPAFSHLTGYSPEEAVGQNPRVLKSGRSRPPSTRALGHAPRGPRLVRRAQQPAQGRVALHGGDDHHAGHRRSGRIAHFVAIKRDITERIALENSLHGARKMEALGQLAGGVAHDFNNLLTVIRGHGELLVGQLAAVDPRREKLEQILEASTGRRS